MELGKLWEQGRQNDFTTTAEDEVRLFILFARVQVEYRDFPPMLLDTVRIR